MSRHGHGHNHGKSWGYSNPWNVPDAIVVVDESTPVEPTSVFAQPYMPYAAIGAATLILYMLLRK